MSKRIEYEENNYLRQQLGFLLWKLSYSKLRETSNAKGMI